MSANQGLSDISSENQALENVLRTYLDSMMKYENVPGSTRPVLVPVVYLRSLEVYSSFWTVLADAL